MLKFFKDIFHYLILSKTEGGVLIRNRSLYRYGTLLKLYKKYQEFENMFFKYILRFQKISYTKMKVYMLCESSCMYNLFYWFTITYIHLLLQYQIYNSKDHS